MNRRSLLKGFAAGVAGLMVPVTVAEAAEEVSRKYWSLGAVPGDDWHGDIERWRSDLLNYREDMFLQWIEAKEPLTYYIGQSYYPEKELRLPIYASDRFMNMGRREVLSNE